MDSTNSIMANKLKLLGVSNTVLIEKAGFELKGNEETIKRNGKLNYTGIVRQAYDYITSSIDKMVPDNNIKQLWKWFDKSKINGSSLADNVLQYLETDIIEESLRGASTSIVEETIRFLVSCIQQINGYRGFGSCMKYKEYRFNGEFWEINDLDYIPSSITVQDVMELKLSSIKFMYGGSIRCCFENSAIMGIDCENKVITMRQYFMSKLSGHSQLTNIRLKYDVDDDGIDIHSMY